MFKNLLILLNAICLVTNVVSQPKKSENNVNASLSNEIKSVTAAKAISKELRKILSNITNNMNDITMLDNFSPYYKYMNEYIINEYLTELDEIDIDNIPNEEKLKDISECINSIIKKVPRMKRELNHSYSSKCIIARKSDCKFIDNLDKQLKALKQTDPLLHITKAELKVNSEASYDNPKNTSKASVAFKTLSNELLEIIDDIKKHISTINISSRYYKYVNTIIIERYSYDIHDIVANNNSIIEQYNDLLDCINNIIHKVPKIKQKLVHSRSLKSPKIQKEQFKFINNIDDKLKILRNKTEKIFLNVSNSVKYYFLT